ncbi:hypothetical protein [Pedobacter sp.]|uniref:hypothetical protein n=1 Tax=Pedobacter sp. TaxID=1411316 RepID=UPI003D7F348A
MILNTILTDILISNPTEKWDFFLKSILPLLGPALVVFTFSMNYSKDRKNKRKEAKRAWYFKAYFEPNIKKVEVFFDESSVFMEKSIENFNSQYIHYSLDARVAVVAEVLGALASKKRRFLIEVVDMLKLAYKKEAGKIELILNDFEDSGTNVFDNIEQTIDPDSFYKYLSEITEIKARLVKTLSKPAILKDKKKKKDSTNSVVINLERRPQ